VALYTQTTLDSLAIQIGVLLDDQTELYWSRQEKYLAIWEGLRVWGALTSHWRTRGTFNLDPARNYYDLSVELPALRTRSWTLDKIVREIQYMSLEAPSSITGAGASGQISTQSILQAVQRARNQFVIDAKLPLSITASLSSPPAPDGMVQFSNNSVFVHRASWKDAFTGKWSNLWRQDAWAVDHNDPIWTVSPGQPIAYSESENSPLKLQLVPLPVNTGTLEVMTVDSFLIDTTNPDATFNVPDEWVHAIKYCALSDLYSSESQNTDPVRSQYAGLRYKQAMDVISGMRSVVRATCENVPVPLDSLAALDSSTPYWRNQKPGRPNVFGCAGDILVCGPVNRAYGMSVDVIQSAPIPATGPEFIPLGPEDVGHLIDYVTHILIYKCGGKEFEQTFGQYDDFLEAASMRGNINKAKISYLGALLGQPQKEQLARPDALAKAG
jgi:hypothetical protein